MEARLQPGARKPPSFSRPIPADAPRRVSLLPDGEELPFTIVGGAACAERNRPPRYVRFVAPRLGTLLVIAVDWE